jgi:hypothetical protein
MDTWAISIGELIEICMIIKELACQPKLAAAGAVHRCSPEIRASYGGQPWPRTKARMEAPPGFEPGMEVLQTSALPLGDGAARNAQIVRERPAADDTAINSQG